MAHGQVLVLRLDDPLAKTVHDVDDLEAQLPGAVSALREWLRVYKARPRGGLLIRTARQPARPPAQWPGAASGSERRASALVVWRAGIGGQAAECLLPRRALHARGVCQGRDCAHARLLGVGARLQAQRDAAVCAQGSCGGGFRAQATQALRSQQACASLSYNVVRRPLWKCKAGEETTILI